MQKRSSLLAEFSWLAFFLVVFAILVYAFNIFIVPHHFNDKIAIVLAGIIAALIMMTVRARWPR